MPRGSGLTARALSKPGFGVHAAHDHRVQHRPVSGSWPTQEATVSLASLQEDAALPDAGDADGGLTDLCRRAFPGQYIDSCTLATVDGGQAIHVVYNAYCHSGRRPAGLASPAGQPRTSALGVWLAGVTHLEAASAYAFGILADELELHGAPTAFVAAARGGGRRAPPQQG